MGTFVDNDEYEKNNSADTESKKDNIIPMENNKKARPAFAFWKVDEDTELQLKLTTPQTLELEKKFRKNLINLIGDEDNIPALTTMLQVVHAAAVPWNHGIKLRDVMNYYDKYQEAGGTQINFYVDVYIQVFMVSGFFSSSMVEEVTDSMDRVRENM